MGKAKKIKAALFCAAALAGLLLILLPAAEDRAREREAEEQAQLAAAAEAARRMEEEEARLRLEKKGEDYAAAKRLLYSRNFQEGTALLKELGDFEDSKELADYVRGYIADEPEFGPNIIAPEYLEESFPQGKMYDISSYGRYTDGWKFRGLVYVPDTVDETTSFIQYYAGGGDSGDYLWYYGVYRYFEKYFPNAIIVFTNESGIRHIGWRNEMQWDVLRQIAYECGTIVHDLSVIGSSNGCYTALSLAWDYYENYGLKVKRVCTLDTGCTWDLGYASLTREQCAQVAEAGTELFLFEGDDFEKDLDKQAVADILQSEIELHTYICKHGGHDDITHTAFRLGIFDFCIDPETGLPEYEYCPVEIEPGMEELEDVSWPETPEDEVSSIPF